MLQSREWRESLGVFEQTFQVENGTCGTTSSMVMA